VHGRLANRRRLRGIALRAHDAAGPLLCSAIGWLAMIWWGSDESGLAMCHPNLSSIIGTAKAAATYALAVQGVGSLVLSWLLMLLAMMSPLVIVPLRYLKRGAPAKRRPRTALLFLAAYTGVWCFTGGVLTVLGFVLEVMAPAAALPLCIALAFAWSCSPMAHMGIRRCHLRPNIGGIGLRADLDVVSYGIAFGGACVVTCWIWMLLPFCAGRWHLIAMGLAAAAVAAQRSGVATPRSVRVRGNSAKVAAVRA
jgi:predicted metal-binding membrane protein